MKDNIILEKSSDFAVRVVKLYKHLCDDQNDKHVQTLVSDIDEIVRLLTSIVKSSQEKNLEK